MKKILLGSSWGKEKKDYEGEIIKGIYTDGESEFIIESESGFYKYYCDGDCCSHSYVSDIICSPLLSYSLGTKCIGVFEMEDMGEVEASTQDEDHTYGYEIRFEEGSLFITHRNSSNGYYGGDTLYEGKIESLPDNFTRVDSHFISKYV